MTIKRLTAMLLVLAMLMGCVPVVFAEEDYAYLSSDQLTGYAESWCEGASTYTNAVDGDVTTQWHSAYPGNPAEETEDNHYLRNADGNLAQNNTDNNNLLGKYNNYYIVLDEARTVNEISILGKWENGLTNGTPKTVNVYVSELDYGSDKDISWGEPVGKGEFTYAGQNDMKKLVTFDEAQSNVKTVRIEFTETYSGGSNARNKWIRVLEFGVSAKKEAEKEPEQVIIGYEYMGHEALTGYAESWSADSTAASAAVDGNTAKGSNWHSGYPGFPEAETEDNHYLRSADGQIAKNNTSGAANPLGQYNNYYLVLDEAQTVDKISIYSLWDNQVTNGTAKEVKVYVSSEDYGENKKIEWGEPVGASPEGGFTYSANDVKKEVAFDQVQSNVKSIRIEFIRTYDNGGSEGNHFIRVMEFDVSAAVWGDSSSEPETKVTLSAYAESWQTGSEPKYVVDGDASTQWHSMYSGTETADNHIPQDANGNSAIDNDNPLARYNNLYLVLSEATTVENIYLQGKWNEDKITNGTPQQVKVYVSTQDYSSGETIEWGEPVGASPSAGYTYKNASDMMKYVEFASAQENVKSIRIEFTHTYSQQGTVNSKWIRLVEAGINAEIPEKQEYLPLPDEDPIFTIAAVADIHTDYGLEVSETHIRETATAAAELIKQENANVIVNVGDSFSANDTSHWFAGSVADRKEIYNQVVEALHSTLTSAMEDPKIMYVAGNHETEIGCRDFNSQAYIKDLTERTMGEMVAATSVNDMEANAWIDTDLSDIMDDPEGQMDVLAYYYNVDGVDFFGLSPRGFGRRNNEGLYEFDDDALTWMRNKMESLGKDKTFFIVSHYPVGTHYKGDTEGSANEATETKLREIFAEFPNTILLYGHVHTQYIVEDTAEAIVAYEADAQTVHEDTYSTPSGFLNVFCGSQGYYGTPAGLVPQGWLSAQTPNYNQVLFVYIYSDRICFQMKNCGEAGGDLTPYTIMRQVNLDVEVDKTKLNTLIEEAEALTSTDYTQATWANLEQALTAARELSADEAATQSKVNKAVKTLQSAMDELLAVADCFGFADLTISILGDSISTFENVSSGTGANIYNSTIGNNAVYYYTSGTFGVQLEDTWWMQTTRQLGMRLLVNNSVSGSTVFSDRDWPGNQYKAYLDRSQNLHDDVGENSGEEPDIIAIYMGTNDFTDNPTLGTAVTDPTTLITENGDGTYSYSTPTTLAEAYSIMLYRVTKRYPDAEIYCFSLLPRQGQTETEAERMAQYSAVFQTTAQAYGAYFVDVYHDSGITADSDNAAWYMGNLLHPNCAGMDALTNTFVSALLRNSKYSTVSEEKLYNVSYELNHVIVKEGTVQTAVAGESFRISFVEPSEGTLRVKVTMNGEDVTEEAYANGVVFIEEVNGDIRITADNGTSAEEQEALDKALAAARAAMEAAEKAQQEAEDAKATAEAAKEAAEKAKAAAEEAKNSSAQNKEAAERAQTAAEEAQKKAEEAAKRAEEVIAAAEEARKAAEAASDAAEKSNLAAAEEAKKAAQEAQKAAESSNQAVKSAEEAAASAAEAAAAQAAAQAAAEQAENAAQKADEAQKKAEQARNEAQEAAKAAGNDKSAAEAAAKAAQEAQEAAETAQKDAENAAQAAEDARINALAAEKAAESANRAAAQAAAEAAEAARQAAADAGKAAEQAALIAEYAAQAAAAQAAAAEAQAAAEAAQAAAEEAAKKSAAEKAAAEAAKKAAEEAAAAAQAAADLETAKQAALLEVMLLRNTTSELTTQQKAYRDELFAETIEAIVGAESAEAVAQYTEALREAVEQLSESQNVNDFVDVPADAWFHDAVDYASARGYMIGMSDNTFVPGGNLSRGQFATILYRLDGMPDVTSDVTFKDVESDVWYTNGILWASENGIVNGYPGNVFGVADNITREQMITMLYRYCTDYKHMDTTARAELGRFSDGSTVSEYARDAMSWAIQSGLIQGMTQGSTMVLNPQGSTTRAECAAIIQRFMERIAQ